MREARGRRGRGGWGRGERLSNRLRFVGGAALGCDLVNILCINSESRVCSVGCCGGMGGEEGWVLVTRRKCLQRQANY